MQTRTCIGATCSARASVFCPTRGRKRRSFADGPRRPGRWCDRETDEEYERERERARHNRKLRETRTSSLKEGEARGEVRGREAERTNQAIVALHVFLGEELAPADLIRIETVWRRSGPPKDVMDRIKTVQQTPSEWRSLLPNESDGDNDPGRIPPPREPGPPRDG